MTNLMGKPPLGQKAQSKPQKASKPMRKMSAKKVKYRASAEGKAAVEYMGLVKQLPCCVCGAPPPSIAHHVFHGRYGTRRASDFDTIPLCSSDHDSWQPNGIHNIKEQWAARHGSDYSYIEATRKLVSELFD